MFLEQQMQLQSSYRLNQQYNQTKKKKSNKSLLLLHVIGLTCVARSPITAVSIPIIKIDTVKQTQPPPMPKIH